MHGLQGITVHKGTDAENPVELSYSVRRLALGMERMLPLKRSRSELSIEIHRDWGFVVFKVWVQDSVICHVTCAFAILSMWRRRCGIRAWFPKTLTNPKP